MKHSIYVRSRHNLRKVGKTTAMRQSIYPLRHLDRQLEDLQHELHLQYICVGMRFLFTKHIGPEAWEDSADSSNAPNYACNAHFQGF